MVHAHNRIEFIAMDCIEEDRITGFRTYDCVPFIFCLLYCRNYLQQFFLPESAILAGMRIKTCDGNARTRADSLESIIGKADDLQNSLFFYPGRCLYDGDMRAHMGHHQFLCCEHHRNRRIPAEISDILRVARKIGVCESHCLLVDRKGHYGSDVASKCCF